MQLSLLTTSRTVKRAKRVARGNGSGKGTTAGRGTKGQLSRGRGKVPAQFEGGQTSFIQKLPKTKGFKRSMKVTAQPISLDMLESKFNDGDTVSIEALYVKKLLSGSMQSAKVLAKGKLTKKLTIDIPASSEARNAIEKAGGKVVEKKAEAPEKKTKKKA